MHPLSTALFLLGYALALPIAFKMTTVVERQSRLSLFGHQAGILVATLGWLFSGRIFIAIGHIIWLLVAYFWFNYFGPAKQSIKTRMSERG